MPDPDRIRDLFARLTVWSRGDQRAPHKPLLVLLALGYLERGERQIGYRMVEEQLTSLLEEFGPPRKAHHPEYPFWRLQNDGVWTVFSTRNLKRRKSNTDPLKSELKKYNTPSGFSDPVYAALSEDVNLRREVATLLLDEHFPASLHEDILDAVGLSLRSTRIDRRDPNFRREVMRAYEYQCAVCGFNLRFNHRPVGLEAAHIKWHQARGPDTVENGLALCALHHKLFDKGAIRLKKDYQLLVAEDVHGDEEHMQALMQHHGQQIRLPQRTHYYPSAPFISWHVREVFKGPARQLTS